MIYTNNACTWSLKITNVNDGYKLSAADDDSSIFLQSLRSKNIITDNNVFKVLQDADEIDLEDRIEKGRELISALLINHFNNEALAANESSSDGFELPIPS